VAGFVGRDRGYRALGFTVADALPLHDEPTITLGSSLADAPRGARDGWVLVVDSEQHPQGWLALTGVPDSALHGEVTPDLLNLGGTLAAQGGTLREALDAALSSPSGRGVIVDGEDRLVGTVSPSEVLARIEAHAQQARHAPAEIGTS
jgi:osmoprotectant transport system ATP-binding protein